MITTLIARFGTYIGIGAAIIVGFLAWDSSRVNHGRNIEKQATEKANEQVKGKGRGAAAKSSSAKPGDRGVLVLDLRD